MSPIVAGYGTDQFSNRINDKCHDNIVKPLHSFSFKSTIPFQNKFKTPAKKHNKSLDQQSLFLMTLMSLGMTMIIYTLAFQDLPHFHPLIN